MHPHTIEACAEFTAKAGQMFAALIREQPDCISTQAFKDFAVVVMKVSNAIREDPGTTIKGSEIFKEFQVAREYMIECLEAEQRHK